VPAELDPASASTTVVGEVKLADVPQHVRMFSYHPCTDKLQPGDLVLLRPVKSTWLSEYVQRAQSHVGDRARWIHAAMYIGRNLIIELDGVAGFKIEPLWKYTQTHAMCFRRPLKNNGLGPSPEEDVDELTGHKIAIAGLQNYKTKYSLLDAARSGVEAVINPGTPKTRVEIRTAGAVCSTFYCDAVYQVLHRQPVPPIRGAQLFQPADLRCSSYLRDVDEMAWAKIAY
jgi:hypothetical protein